MRGGGAVGMGVGEPMGGGAVLGNIGAGGGMAPGAGYGSGCASMGPSTPATPATAPPLPQQHGSHSQQGRHRENHPKSQQQPESINRLPDKASVAQRTRRMEVTLCSGRAPHRKRVGHMVHQT